MSFTNTVSGLELTDVGGDLRLDVSIVASDGWSAVLASGPVTRSPAGRRRPRSTSTLDGAAALLNRHHDEIGTGAGSATLTVTPGG